MVSDLALKVGMKSAKKDLNQTCAMFIYQPKQPQALKNTKKNG